MSAESTAVDANHGVKQLLRACLQSEEVADAMLPDIVESGAVEGLLGENIFRQLWEARQRDEKLNLSDSEGVSERAGKTAGAGSAILARGLRPNLEQARVTCAS